ncbi:hypothetical protein ACJU26_01910 [Acidithiobacillus sp. M4-SHS-6]|uniref:hypothetical protein n=1 Tax=Acidithiobacillus sp. M4-SHS-6 TaxID=3383024 RepID=UPI0039BE6F36
MMTPAFGEVLERWRSASGAGQAALWADPAQRVLLRSAWQQDILPCWWGAEEATEALQVVADSQSIWAESEHLPVELLAAAVAIQESKRTQMDKSALPDALLLEAGSPMPLDMEVDLLSKAVEEADLEQLVPLLQSMADDDHARRIVLNRLAQRLADDSHAQGLRSILFGQWQDAAADLPARPFALGALALLHSHWQQPAGVAVVVPEGRASRDSEVDKPLLHALRERDLPAFMGRVRAMGDQPLDAIRQLFLTVTLMIVEGGQRHESQALMRLYVWLGTLLTLPHRSLRQARKVLFSAAASTFGFAGWQRRQDWPDFSTLAAYRERALSEPAPAPFTWQGALYAAASGTAADWWLQVAERAIDQDNPSGFWPLWRSAQRAGQVTGGPLAWIHPLVVLRFYFD